MAAITPDCMPTQKRHQQPADVATLRVVMERSFSRFTASAKTQFLDDLVFLTGTTRDAIVDINIYKGCVRFEAKLSEAIVRRLAELFSRLHRHAESDPELDAFRAFVQKHRVTHVGAEYTVNVQILTRSAARRVVFVHGWRGGPGSFGNFPNLIQESTGLEVSTYEYPSGFWKGSPSLIYVSRNLDNWVRNHASSAELAFVAHSYGGLVVRKLMTIQASYPDPLDHRTRHLFFLASPHNGTVLANLAGRVPGIDKDQVRELSPGSPVLFELNEQWQSWASRMIPTVCQVRSIVAVNDAVVPTNSALGLDPHPAVILNRDHSNIAQVMTAQDEVFATVSRLLTSSHFADHLDAGPVQAPTVPLTSPPHTPEHFERTEDTFVVFECTHCGRSLKVARTVTDFECSFCHRSLKRQADDTTPSRTRGVADDAAL